MSRVIGFRLDENNQREAQALLVLRQWQEKGYSTRHILTEALLRLETPDEERSASLQLDNMLEMLHRITEQLASLQLQGHRVSHSLDKQRDDLSRSFILSVREAARPGIKLNS